MKTIYQVKNHKYEIEISLFVVSDKDKDYTPKGQGNKDKSIQSSISRTKRVIKDYARNNDFDYFVTLTFDTKKVDSSNQALVLSATQRYTRMLRQQGIKYLIVPEYHADGHKIHLHALIKGSMLLQDSGKLDKSKRTIYNVPSWHFGYSTAIKISNENDSTLKIANYIVKYITKDLLINFDKKRYWISNGLTKPSILIRSFNPKPDLLEKHKWQYISKKTNYRSMTIKKQI